MGPAAGCVAAAATQRGRLHRCTNTITANESSIAANSPLTDQQHCRRRRRRHGRRHRRQHHQTKPFFSPAAAEATAPARAPVAAPAAAPTLCSLRCDAQHLLRITSAWPPPPPQPQPPCGNVYCHPQHNWPRTRTRPTAPTLHFQQAGWLALGGFPQNPTLR